MEYVLERMAITDGSWSRTLNFWDWGSGVGLFGVKEAHQATGDNIYLDFIKKWFDDNMENRRITTVNCVIPCEALLYLYQKEKKPCYKEVLDDYEKWCTTTSLKTINGGISHIWSEAETGDYKNQIWADTIFMAVMFMFDYGIMKEDESLINAAFKQLEIHIDCLRDEKTGLFYHGYHCNKKEHMGQIWGRGNGWVVAALSRLIPILENKGYNMDKYKSVFVKAMDSAYKNRLENGMLRTLITDNEAYKEMSASMLFGYAALNGAESKLLPEKYLLWAKQIEKCVEYDGSEWIKYISAGTNPQGRGGYLDRPYIEANYGHGIALMFFSALYKIYNNK